MGNDLKWADVAHYYIKSGIYCQWNQIDEDGEDTGLRLGGRFNAAKPLLYAGTVD